MSWNTKGIATRIVWLLAGYLWGHDDWLTGAVALIVGALLMGIVLKSENRDQEARQDG